MYAILLSRTRELKCSLACVQGSRLTDERTQLVGQLPLPCREDLATNVLEDDRPRLQIHHKHGFELGLSPLQLHLSHRSSKDVQISNHIMD